MGTTDWSEIPFPSRGDPDDVPADLEALATHIASRVVLRATSLSDRNDKYSDTPYGTLVVAPNVGMWVKASSLSNTWQTVWEAVPGWSSLPLFDDAKYEYNTSLSGIGQIREYMGQVYIRGIVQRSNGWLIPDDGDTIATLCSIPDEFRPARRQFRETATSLEGAVTQSAGRLEIGTGGSIIFGSQERVSWVSVACSYWKDI